MVRTIEGSSTSCPVRAFPQDCTLFHLLVPGVSRPAADRKAMPSYQDLSAAALRCFPRHELFDIVSSPQGTVSLGAYLLRPASLALYRIKV